MTDSDFEDAADFDVKDISTILHDIDSVNLALDSLDGRADKLTASLASLLQAQSQLNPFAHVAPEPLESENKTEATADKTAHPTLSKSTPSAPASEASSVVKEQTSATESKDSQSKQ